MTTNILSKTASSDIFYRHVNVDVPPTYMKLIVGKKGKHLKQSCVELGVKNIWFNMKRNILEIWGPRTNLTKAADHFIGKIDIIRKKIPDQELKTFIESFVREEDVFVSGSVDGVVTKEKMRLLIGKSGRHFKRITKETGVSFIWYNDETNSIDVWGPKDSLAACVQELASWMNTFEQNTPTQVDQMEVEMCP